MLNWISERLAQFLVDLASSSPIAATFFGILGTLVVVASFIIMVTPTKTDDDWWSRLHGVPFLGAILTVLERLSFLKRRE